MTKRKPSPQLLAVILAAHLAVTAITWRDLRHRTAAEVRGDRRIWRVATAANSAASVVYFLFGRKHAAGPGGA